MARALASNNGNEKDWLLPVAITAVCRTFASDPAASAGLIRSLLEPPKWDAPTINALHWLTREIKPMCRETPDLASEIYVRVFREEPPEKTPVQMWRSQIMSLTTTLRQNLDVAAYGLGNDFGEFLNASPEFATLTLVKVIKEYAQRHQHLAESEPESMRVGEHTCLVLSDRSHIWDRRDSYEHDPPVMMLKAFEKYLSTLTSMPTGGEAFQRLLSRLGEAPIAAVIWRRVIRAAAESPSTFGLALKSLLTSESALLSPELSQPSANLLQKVFSLLDRDEREQVERFLMAVRDLPRLSNAPDRDHERDRLLGKLALEDLMTVAAREHLQRMSEEGRLLPGAESNGMKRAWSSQDSEEERYRRQGIDRSLVSNREIQELRLPVKAFVDEHRQKRPLPASVAAVLPQIATLTSAIETHSGAHAEIILEAETILAEAAAAIAQSPEAMAEASTRKAVRASLLRAASASAPAVSENADPELDDDLWYAPAPRIEAAQGIMAMSYDAEWLDEEIQSAIRELSRDPVSSVRLQIARELHLLRQSNPALMWELVDDRASNEPNTAVLSFFVGETLGFLATDDPNRVSNYVVSIFRRLSDGKSGSRDREVYVRLLLHLHLHFQIQSASALIESLIRDPYKHAEALARMIYLGRQYLPKQIQHANAQASALNVQKNAWKIIATLAETIGSLYLEFLRKYRISKTIPEADRGQWEACASIAHAIANNIFFASGAFAAERNTTEGALTGEQRADFYSDSIPVVEALARLGIPGVTHKLLEFLAAYIEVDPRGVFLHVALLITLSTEQGYQHEQLGSDVVVKIVERYFAEHRNLFKDDAECQSAVIKVLDIFIDWPAARRLAFRLEEIYR